MVSRIKCNIPRYDLAILNKMIIAIGFNRFILVYKWSQQLVSDIQVQASMEMIDIPQQDCACHGKPYVLRDEL